MEVDREDTGSPVQSAEFYYLKALSYLAMAGGSGEDEESCSCLHCPSTHTDTMGGHGKVEDDEDDDDLHFSMAFRPGLALDDLHPSDASVANEAGSSSSSSGGGGWSEDKVSGHKATSSHTLVSGSRASGRKLKLRVKRKVEDGHVHWADEFQKDLERCHPRKGYSRHPSHHAPAVKPILKVHVEHHEPC